MAQALTVYSPYSSAPEPTAIRRYFNSLMKPMESSYTFDEREGVVHTIIESGATGAVLGAAHAALPTGLDVKKAPIDLIGGLVSVIAASKIHGKVGRSMNAIGGHAVAIYSFRSTAKLMAAKAGVHGDFGDDPLTEAAKDL